MFKNSGGGGHSALLDVFGRYGWVIGVCFVLIFIKAPQKIVVSTENTRVLDALIITTTVLFCLLDSLFQEMSIAIFLFYPLLKHMSYKQLEHGGV